ncbi:MAG: NAD(P)-dependent glycerol-3-phosphate dehydrogenase [Dehalococcoidales bacterium]|nr:NAD(P)-dependent glycerol-3-phosphate dehydrogenase [Dehalococcoidales bacterium]
MQKVAVIGTTSWGITLAMLLWKNGSDVRLWARTLQEANQLKSKGTDRFAGIKIPKEITISHKMEEVAKDIDAVIMAVPSISMRENIARVAKYLTKNTLIISASKGLEVNSNKRMSEVIAEEIKPQYRINICALSGPQLAKEIMENHPAASVVAAEDKAISRRAQRILTTDMFCVFTNTDIIGVELGGALKNILALGAGIADGLGYGDNAKAAFMTRGLTEITALGMALGANPLTFSGLAGLGDVITTCASPLSRNHYVGVELTKGRPLTEILRSMHQVAEGVNTTKAAYTLAQELGLEMPITEKIYEVLYKNTKPAKAAKAMMGGNMRHELVGRRWRLFSLFRHQTRTEETNT